MARSMLSDFLDFWNEKTSLFDWEGVVKASNVRSVIDEIMRLRLKAQKDGGWCTEHKEERYSYLYLLRCFAKSINREDIQKELFGAEFPYDQDTTAILAQHYHSNFSYSDWLSDWMDKFDEMQEIRNTQILQSLRNYLEQNFDTGNLPPNQFIIDSVSTYLSLAKYKRPFSDLATSNDDNIFRYIFVEDINSFVGLYLISDFIEQKLSLLNFRICASDEIGAFDYFKGEIESAVAYGEANIQNQRNYDILSQTRKNVTGSFADSEALFAMNLTKYLFFSNSSQIRIRDSLNQCITYVETPHLVTPYVRHVCLTNMMYLEYLIDSVARNHEKKNYSLYKLEYLLDISIENDCNPSYLVPEELIEDGNIANIDDWVKSQELCYTNVVFENIKLWLEKKQQNEPLGIVSRKKKSTFLQRKYEHLHLYKLLTIPINLPVKGRGRKIDVFFEFQSTKQQYYVEILQYIANIFREITDYIVEQKRYFGAVSLVKILTVDMLLQFSRICAVSSIKVHDEDESGLEFLLNRINWSLERTATALGAFGCEESQSYFWVLSSILTDSVEDKRLDSPRKIANSIQNGLKHLVLGFEHEGFHHEPPRLSVPIITFTNPVMNFDSIEWVKIVNK